MPSGMEIVEIAFHLLDEDRTEITTRRDSNEQK